MPNVAGWQRYPFVLIKRKIRGRHLSNHILELLGCKLVDIGVHLEIVGHNFGKGLPLRILWHVKLLFDLE